MKKFKHKKTGIIGEVKEDGWLHFQRCHGNECSLESISMELVEGSTDWEEIKELDYEVLSVLYGENKKVYIKDGDHFKHEGGVIRLECAETGNLLNPPQNGYEIDIHSVKRLSDGEIFTVGDKVNIGLGDRVIEGFRVVGDILCVDHNKGVFSNDKGGGFKNAKKAVVRKKVDKYTYEGKTYIILGYVPFKHPDTRKWLDAVHYLQLESGLDFVREKEEWFRQFKLVE